MAKPKWTLHSYKDKAYFWRWRLVARNGKIIADSGEGYSSRTNALRAARKLVIIAVQAVIE